MPSKVPHASEGNRERGFHTTGSTYRGAGEPHGGGRETHPPTLATERVHPSCPGTIFRTPLASVHHEDHFELFQEACAGVFC